MSKKNKVIFVKYPLCLSYIFSPSEARFIIHMLDAEFLKSYGYDTNFSRKEYMKRMGLSEYSFDNAVKKMIEMGLLTKTNNKLKNRVYYSFNVELYKTLVSILSVTVNIDKLIEFCNNYFKIQKRSIESITQEEIDSLKSEPDSDLKKNPNR